MTFSPMNYIAMMCIRQTENEIIELGILYSSFSALEGSLPYITYAGKTNT